MKLNYLSRLKTEVLSNLKARRILMHFVVLSSEAWSSMKLLVFVIGDGSGARYYVLPSLIMRPLLFLLVLLKAIITSLSFTKLDSKQVWELTDLGVLHRMIIHTSRKEK